MKLFDDFEAVKFLQENMIFITRDGFLYYIYDFEHKKWKKYQNIVQTRFNNYIRKILSKKRPQNVI